jgi:hypothetical protein
MKKYNKSELSELIQCFKNSYNRADFDRYPECIDELLGKENANIVRELISEKNPNEAYEIGLKQKDNKLLEIARKKMAEQNAWDTYHKGLWFKDKILIRLSGEQLLLQKDPDTVYMHAFCYKDKWLMKKALEAKLERKKG